mmetsp:Transcript_29193/g.28815  ORF Transcript_29193/g.28815 Transcript_29193/m.28815 type:complete len:291 (-) Transcript_29193:319-1191(-)
MLLQIIIRWIKKLQGSSGTEEVKETEQDIASECEEEIMQIWLNTQGEVLSLLQLLSGDSLAGILICIEEVCKTNISLIFQSKECSEGLLKGFLEMCQRSCEFNLKFMKAKVMEEIINIFKIIFDASNESRVTPKMIQIVFECMKTILMAMKDHDKSFTNKNPAKLTFDEKRIFGFIEQLGYNIKNNECLLVEIINTFMKFSIIDPHLEAFGRRSLVLIYNLILQGRITDEDILKKILPLLESRIVKFMSIRYKVDEALALATNVTEKLQAPEKSGEESKETPTESKEYMR